MTSTVFVHLLWSAEKFLSQKLSAYPFFKSTSLCFKMKCETVKTFQKLIVPHRLRPLKGFPRRTNR